MTRDRDKDRESTEKAAPESAEEGAKGPGEPGSADPESPPRPEPNRRGLRRSRPISIIPEISDSDRTTERRRRFFTRAMNESGAQAQSQAASGVRRRWRWFRTDARPPSDLTDTEARAEAAKSAAAELRSRLKSGPVSRQQAAQLPPGSGTSTRNPLSPVTTSTETAPAAPSAIAFLEELAARGSAEVTGEPPGWREDRAESRAEPGRAESRAEPGRAESRAEPGKAGSPGASPVSPAAGAAILDADAAARGRAEPAPDAPGEKALPIARVPGLRRLRRPLTTLLRPPAWQRHDLTVVAIAIALFLTGAVAQRRMSAPSLRPISQFGLHLSSPSGWLPARRVGRPPAGLAARSDIAETGGSDVDAGDEPGAALPYHVVIQSALDPFARVEIRVAQRPSAGNLRSALVLERISRHGEAHWAADSTDRTIGGRDWVRTEYRYAYKGSKSDAPRIATGIEYAITNGRLLYTVTLHGSDDTARQLERLLVPTLSVDANHPAAVGGR